MEDRKSMFVPCSGSTGAPELLPVGEVIEIPDKGLRVFHIDRGQIRMLEEFYGLNNGRKSDFQRLQLALEAGRKTRSSGRQNRFRGGGKRV
ncbi:MAG: hypothetical protein ACPLRW_08825 [Moorellales bacterium]